MLVYKSHESLLLVNGCLLGSRLAVVGSSTGCRAKNDWAQQYSVRCSWRCSALPAAASWWAAAAARLGGFARTAWAAARAWASAHAEARDATTRLLGFGGFGADEAREGW